MQANDHDDTTNYSVVVNHEEQYSTWPLDRDMPLGWKSIGKTGRKHECLEYIERVWTDMRPLSLRRHMNRVRCQVAALSSAIASRESEEPGPRPSLVELLCSGSHPVEVALPPEKRVAALRACLDRGYVPIRLPQTRGGTELGMRLVKAATVLHGADLETSTGAIHLESELTLNGTRLRCAVDLDAATMLVEVTIGVQRPEHVDAERVRAALPHGVVTVRVVPGGLDVPSPDGRDPAVIASAAIAVRFPALPSR